MVTIGLLAGAGGGIAWLILSAAYRTIKVRYTPPSKLAAGVEKSLSKRPDEWWLSTSGYAILNETAGIEVSLADSDFGVVELLSAPNRGPRKIATFRGADLLAFRRGYSNWKKATAEERKATRLRHRRAVTAKLAA